MINTNRTATLRELITITNLKQNYSSSPVAVGEAALPPLPTRLHPPSDIRLDFSESRGPERRAPPMTATAS